MTKRDQRRNVVIFAVAKNAAVLVPRELDAKAAINEGLQHFASKLVAKFAGNFVRNRKVERASCLRIFATLDAFGFGPHGHRIVHPLGRIGGQHDFRMLQLVGLVREVKFGVLRASLIG
ncbi:hypothetical protein CLV78_105217 [Aliiruegeria haliotis]|uniref:Uncharacterized protein n=1 Tax=Aliiruegeria haliotis TaxID=1280846 RepID=A0A2T0RQ02_9RHOB|nr:hypothetical protein CLV78_105217 [Aliiruegeria haliotis]